VTSELRRGALDAVALDSPEAKVRATLALRDRVVSGGSTIAPEALLPVADTPGRPPTPRLVDPRTVPRRRIGTPEGRAALIHAIAHIEFNAINLALDACCRFPGLPNAFYADWLQVAAEEATHFDLLARRLAALGHAYGDFEAHDGLWDAARRTAADPLLRMALVPRVLEARGLDVTPALRDRLDRIGDAETAAVLDVILRDEVGHVAIGSHWFAWLCDARGVDAVATFRSLIATERDPRVRLPLNREARRLGGFSESELAFLDDCAKRRERREPHAPAA
jgi:uncharacterized ferritin-like protein (DUF455 family)